MIYTVSELNRMSIVKNYVSILVDEGTYPNAENVFERWNDIKWYNYCSSCEEFGQLLTACFQYCCKFFKDGVNIPEIVEILDLHINPMNSKCWTISSTDKNLGLYASNVCWAHNVPNDWDPGEYLVFPFNDENDIEWYYNKVTDTGWELGGDDLFMGFDGSAMSSTMNCFIDKTFIDTENAGILRKQFVDSVFETTRNLFDIYKKQSA